MSATGAPSARALATRERLLDVGVDLFGRHAYDELSIEDIAAAAGVSHGLLYHHFGSKRGYYLAALERVAGELEELVVQATDDPDIPLRERVRIGLATRVDFLAARATGYRMVTQGGIGADPEAQAIIERTRRASVERGLAELGGAASDPRLALAIDAWTGFFERAMTRWLDEPRVSRDELVDLLADSLLATVGAAAR